MPIPSPNLHAAPPGEISGTLREVVDESDRPFCLMPEALVLRQGLRHRAVALLLRDPAGHALLRTHPRNGWGFSSLALPRARESAEDCCRRLLVTDWDLGTATPRLLRRADACAETGMAFLTLFEARVSAATARMLAAPGAIMPEGLPLPDAIDLAGLARQEEPLLSPLLRHAVRSGWLER